MHVCARVSPFYQCYRDGRLSQNAWNHFGQEVQKGCDSGAGQSAAGVKRPDFDLSVGQATPVLQAAVFQRHCDQHARQVSGVRLTRVNAKSVPLFQIIRRQALAMVRHIDTGRARLGDGP